MRNSVKITVFVVLLALGLFNPHVASAQGAETPNESAAPSAHDGAGNSGGTPEKSSEDESAQFKSSASVRLLAKATGLTLEQAYWLAVVLNFGIIAGFIAWAARKNLPAAFRSRTASIQKSIAEARRASEEANRRLSEIETRLGRLGEEIARMRTTAEQEAAAEEERIKAAAAEDARRIAESARQEIAAAAKAARRELTAYAADLAVSLAAKQFQVDAPTDRALLRRFAQQLSDDGAPGKKV
ncbi:MAG TPA: ATP synthase F0 subunit B [Terriglobales bacterium]|nr:ATP synthase F0 subunit B [Terriglobales bacterium]